MSRFTIRDVLWLTALVAIAGVWALDHWRMEAQLQIVRRHYPMLYETTTGRETDTNNLKPSPNRPAIGNDS
jgi:hypothetical protein